MQNESFVASVNSSRPYYPMLLSNGNDAVLINYSGAMISSLTGHSHYEQHQGAPCAWYRISHAGNRKSGIALCPILQTGYQVIVDGEVCEPSYYSQKFDPQKSILRTITESWGLRLEVETFLTRESVLVERYRALKAPENSKLLLFIRSHCGGTSGISEHSFAEIKFGSYSSDGFKFNFLLDGIRGAGAMYCDHKGRVVNSGIHGLEFDNIKKGWTGTRFTVIKDDTECRNYKAAVIKAVSNIRKKRYSEIRAEHVADWAEYSNQSRIRIPDNQMQYLYDLSVYSLRANQHPDTGAVVCGMLPFLWGGGVVCPYDASYTHRAFLCGNKIAQALKHAEFHLSRRKQACKDASRLGLKGAAYSGWANCDGRHRGLKEDFARYILQYKPLMSAFLVIDYYNLWKFAPDKIAGRRYLGCMQEILDLAIENFIIEKGHKAVMRSCTAGNESNIKVQNDTLNSIMYARALKDYAQMAEEFGVDDWERYRTLSEKLYRGLQGNFRKDGVLLPWKGAKYLTGLQLQFYLWNLPEGITHQSVRAYLKEARTPWGLDSIQPSEQYRDWPWHATRAAIALAHMGDSKESFKHLLRFSDYASSLGAIPEKIRIDGYPIGYWYSTPYAIFVWAVNDAFCHDGSNGNIRLLWGLDGTWKDAECNNIRVADGILISCKIKCGKLVELRLKNTSEKKISRCLELNPVYKPQKFPNTVELLPGKTLRVIK